MTTKLTDILILALFLLMGTGLVIFLGFLVSYISHFLGLVITAGGLTGLFMAGVAFVTDVIQRD